MTHEVRALCYHSHLFSVAFVSWLRSLLQIVLVGIYVGLTVHRAISKCCLRWPIRDPVDSDRSSHLTAWENRRSDPADHRYCGYQLRTLTVFTDLACRAKLSGRPLLSSYQDNTSWLLAVTNVALVTCYRALLNLSRNFDLLGISTL